MSGLAPNTYAALSITLAAAAAALVLRLCARRMTRMPLWYDDYLAVVAFVFATGYSAICLIWTIHYRFGQTLEPFDDQRAEYIREKSRLFLYAGGIIYASSIAASKLSILSMYWRLFQFTSARYPILILIVLSSVWYIIRTFMVIFQCIPVQAYWDKSIDDAKCRINGAKFFLGTVLTHSLMDLLILTLPIMEVARMHLPLGQKLAVVGLFAAGSMVFIASVIIIIESAKFDPKSKELPYDVCYNVMAAVVEVNLAIFSGKAPSHQSTVYSPHFSNSVAGCLPILRPIFRKVVAGLSSGASKHRLSLPSRHPPS